MLKDRPPASRGQAQQGGRGVGGGRSGRAGTLWTCTGCNRNNEARFDACHHCRSRPPPAANNERALPPRFTSANPFQRYVPKSSTSSSTKGSGRSSDGSNRARPPTAERTPQWSGHSGDSAGQRSDAVTYRGRTNGDDENQLYVAQNRAGTCIDNLFPELNSEDAGGARGSNGSYGGASYRYSSPSRHRHHRMPQQQPPPPASRVPIDTEAAKTWIYPVNYPVRQYQLQIVTEALFKNTLVSLPTGLGKTLIAAVVMYNFYRWFPEGKVVFLAPTKPLVAQQISACYDIMGVPETDTAELQGSVAPEKRQALWDERRVFFCTPQSMVNDIKHKRCDPGRFVCVVVDEAHRGTGNYAYVTVVREVAAATSHFRVLALSATPGSDIKTIQQVLVNLRISQIECRSEDDPEVARHTHARQIEVVKCKLGSHIDAIRQGLVAVLQPLVARMVDKRVLYTRDPMALKAWSVIQCLHTFRRTAHETGLAHMSGEVEAAMGILAKVVQAKDTLVTHGAAGCLQKLAGMEFEVTRRGFRSNAERGVMQHNAWTGLMKLLRQTAENTSGISIKHPKLIKLKEILREHFARHEAAGKSTRAIVFTQLRDSVEEITEFLAGEDLLRVKPFIGQGNSSGAKARAVAAAAEATKMKARCRSGGGGGKGRDEEEQEEEEEEGEEDALAPKQRLKGQTQKEQKAVVKAFFAGEFNCLVATCIAEEGLDIGEVDLIVSFDALSSPVRMVQRMGRTGRKRAGKVVVLVTEGSEESKLRNSNSKSKSITKALQTRKDKFEMFDGDDPMVPPGPRPRMVKQEMVIVEYHLSQVGGHQRKAGRKGGGGGGRSGGGGRGGGGSVSGDVSDWRLTAAQQVTLVEAYSGEPGTNVYIPEPSSGWRRQKSPWATGKVERSARSRLLCGMKGFVAHQEWELLYDPSDMQLLTANLSEEEGRTSATSTPLRAGGGDAPDVNVMPNGIGDGAGVGDSAGVGGSGGSGGGPRFHDLNTDSDNDAFETHPTKGSAALARAPRAGLAGDSERSGRKEGGCRRAVSAKKTSKRVKKVRRPTGGGVGSDTTTDSAESASSGPPSSAGRAEDTVLFQEGSASSADGTALPTMAADAGSKDARSVGVAAKSATAARTMHATNRARAPTVRRTEFFPNTAGEKITGNPPGWQEESNSDDEEQTQTDEHGRSPSDAVAAGATDLDNDDEETQSDPGFRSPRDRRTRVDGANRSSEKSLDRASASGGGSGSNSGSNGARHAATERWHCGCGCLVKAGHASCRMCGSAAHSVSAASAASFSSSSSLVQSAGDAEGRSSHLGTASSSSPVVCESTVGQNADAGACGGGSGGNTNTQATGSQRDQVGRWECGCGCRMKAGGKLCVMCGEVRPCGRETVALSGGGEGGGGDSGSSSSADSGLGGGGDRGVFRSDAFCRDTTERGRSTLAAKTPSRVVCSVSGDGAPETPVVGEGRWRCEECDSEYGAARLRCRACGTRKPTGAGLVPSHVREAVNASVRVGDPKTDRGGDGGGTLERAQTARGDAQPRPVEARGQGRIDAETPPSGEGAAAAGFCKEGRCFTSNLRDHCAGRGEHNSRKPLRRSKGPPASARESWAARTPESRTACDNVDNPLGGSAQPVVSDREGAAFDGASPCQGGSQSQDDALADMFPSLYQFQADGRVGDRGGVGCAGGEKGATKVVDEMIDEVIGGISDPDVPIAPLIAVPPPSLLLSAPPTLPCALRAQVRDAGRSCPTEKSQSAGVFRPPPAPSPPVGVSLSSAPTRASESEVAARSLGYPLCSTAPRAQLGLEMSMDRTTATDASSPPKEISAAAGHASEEAPDRENSSTAAGMTVVAAAGEAETTPTAGCVCAASATASAGVISGSITREGEVYGSSLPQASRDANDGERGDHSDEEQWDDGADDPFVCRDMAGKTASLVGGSPASGSGGQGIVHVDGGDGLEDPGNAHDDDGVACGVCGGAISKEDDPIILCDGPHRCGTAVHANCYGVAEVPEGPWLCEPCLERDGATSESPLSTAGDNRLGKTARPTSASLARCALCKNFGGALKRSLCGQWVHVVCVWWTPELATDPDTVRPGALAGLDPDRGALTCSACHLRGGAAVQCAAASCLEACHPFCAMRSGHLLREDDGAFELFCRTHSRQERSKQEGERCRDEGKCVRNEDGGSVVAAAGLESDAEAAAKTPALRNGERLRSTPPTSTLTPVASSSPTLVGGRAAESCKRGETDDDEKGEEEGKEADGEELILASTGFSQSQLPPRRRRGKGGGKRLWKNKALVDTDGEEGMGGVHDAQHFGGGSTSAAAVRAGEEISVGESGRDTDTPLKVFDMAPPTHVPQPVSLSEGERGEGVPPSRRKMRRKPLSLAAAVEKCPSSATGRDEGSPAAGGGDDGLMTLSQAVSPLNQGRQEIKRRRLNKKSTEIEEPSEGGRSTGKKRSHGQQRDREEASGRGMQKKKRSDGSLFGGSKGKGKGRECDFDKASYRRFIDTEAEVDDDVSDDDEAELENCYDSQDSFVNDGPMSYETSSSQEETTPLRSQDEALGESELEKEGRGGDGGTHGDRKGKKRRRGVARFDNDEDEKGMYLQLLAQSQPTGPSSRRGHRAADKGRIQESSYGRGRGVGGVGGGHAGGRFAFINAVMKHARDGGDPLDVEEACGSEDGFTQDGYVGTPTQATPTQMGRGAPAAESSPGEAMSSGGSARSSHGQMSDTEQDAQPLYSQALRQARPNSPSSPRASAAAAATSGQRVNHDRREKENAPPGTTSASSSAGNGWGQSGSAARDAAHGNNRPLLSKAVARQEVASTVVGNVGAHDKSPVEGRGTTTHRAAIRPMAPLFQGIDTGCGSPLAPTAKTNARPHPRLSVGSTETSGKDGVNAAAMDLPASMGGDSRDGSEGGGSQVGSTSLTEQQRQKMVDNRSKALARLKQRQGSAKGGGAAAGDGGAPRVAVGIQSSRTVPGESAVVCPPAPAWSQQAASATQTCTQRGRFRMTMDMDSGEDENSDVESGEAVEAGGGGACAASKSVPGEGRVVGNLGGVRMAECSQQAVAAAGAASSVHTRDRNGGLGSDRQRRESPPPLRSPAGPTGSTSTASTATVTVPLSAPRAGALEALAKELRTRPGMAIHASALGGGLRDVDLVVGSQCAVCVRGRRQFLSQTHVSSSPSRPTGAGAGKDASSAAPPPLLELLQECLQRYARVVVIVEGLEGSLASAGGQGAVARDEQLEAVGKVEVLRGATVVSSLGWRETADKVEALVAQEASAGVGLPDEVTGPSLTPSQDKFLAFLLRAPTLSYPGGLFLLQAFRGRSAHEVIASSAREFQTAVPGMTPQQAAKLKRFLMNGGGVSSRRVASVGGGRTSINRR